MQEFFKIFILSTITITFWTAFLLLQDKRGNKLLNRWFAVFLIALTTPQMSLYAEQTVPGGIFELSLAASTFLWLKGPFIWAFIQVLSRANVSVYKMGVHFLPWCCVTTVLCFFPHTFQLFVFLGMAHMLSYLFLALWTLIKKRRYLVEVWQGFKNSAYYWLLYVISGLMMLVAIDFVVMSLVTLNVIASYNLLDYFVFPGFSLYVLSVGILNVYRPEFLFREATSKQSNDLVVIESTQDLSVEQTAVDQKERHLELSATLADTLIHQLNHLMQEQQIYRQNELSLPDLAVYLNISVHQVSELLNVHRGISFYDYVNHYRLKYACDLLVDPNCHLRILDIAFEAGFNNKNSFYRIFKESFSITPNQYRSNALAEVESLSL